jgi:hypothetical protein
VNENAILGNDPDLNSSAREQFVEPAVAVAVKQRFDFRRCFVPAFFECSLASVLRDNDVGSVQFAVANNLHRGDGGDLLAHQLEDRAAEVARDAFVGLRIL